MIHKYEKARCAANTTGQKRGKDMKKVLSCINIALCGIGAITTVFAILALATKMDYLEAGVIALALGSSIGLFIGMGVEEW